ncbi:MAG: histidine ammonia-lyase [Bdellovibrionaceae bacterium]|jgi:histidine ammonia-lyase|nr:histidine ammonia-lyase [Pseudobdellovibrionaceae bacterium]
MIVEISGQGLDLSSVKKVALHKVGVSLSPRAREKMLFSRSFIEQKMARETIYGVNTGFGAFSSVKISSEDIRQLQVNLIRSHAVGVGPALRPEQVRAIMLLRANTLAEGYSGVRPELVDKIVEFLNHDIIPWVPAQGSVGASGDLAPLAHVALALMGEGDVLVSGNPQPAQRVLSERGVSPLSLEAKEGLSLINGCQVMTALGLLELAMAIDLCKWADIAGALSLEALRGSRKAFDPLITAVRPHRGEIITASNLRKLLGEQSAIGLSHAQCERVQDAYSLRCMPAVHGAVKDALKHLERVLVTEANSATDNPLVFAEQEKILSCGNFHGMPVALALDYASMALATLGSISEQRLAKLINPAMSAGLPAFLTPQGGLNSGYMITHVVSAALVSENKVLAHPASVDSIPTSADKEDHVSMGTIAARKLGQIVQNVSYILTHELLAACQGLDLLRPLQSSDVLEWVHQEIRRVVPFAEQDRHFARDVAQVKAMLDQAEVLQKLEKQVGLEW